MRCQYFQEISLIFVVGKLSNEVYDKENSHAKEGIGGEMKNTYAT